MTASLQTVAPQRITAILVVCRKLNTVASPLPECSFTLTTRNGKATEYVRDGSVLLACFANVASRSALILKALVVVTGVFRLLFFMVLVFARIFKERLAYSSVSFEIVYSKILGCFRDSINCSYKF